MAQVFVDWNTDDVPDDHLWKFTRRNSTLVRDRFGRPRFSYDPRKAPVGIRDMLTPEELAALEQYSTDFNELVNDGDPRTSLRRGQFSAKSQAALAAMEKHFAPPEMVTIPD